MKAMVDLKISYCTECGYTCCGNCKSFSENCRYGGVCYNTPIMFYEDDSLSGIGKLSSDNWFNAGCFSDKKLSEEHYLELEKDLNKLVQLLRTKKELFTFKTNCIEAVVRDPSFLDQFRFRNY